MIHDMIEMEKKGKPGVALVSGRFEGIATAQARVFNMPDTRFVVVPWIYRNLDRARTIQQTEAAFETLVTELTTDLAGKTAVAKLAPTEMERFEGSDRLDAL